MIFSAHIPKYVCRPGNSIKVTMKYPTERLLSTTMLLHLCVQMEKTISFLFSGVVRIRMLVAYHIIYRGCNFTGYYAIEHLLLPLNMLIIGGEGPTANAPHQTIARFTTTSTFFCNVIYGS